MQITFTAEALGLPAGVPLKSRDLTVDVKKKHLKICLKGKQPLVDGEMHKEVKTGDIIWTVEDSKKLVLTLDKVGLLLRVR